MKNGAGNETRTRDPNLGKVVLYQLSYSRLRRGHLVATATPRVALPFAPATNNKERHWLGMLLGSHGDPQDWPVRMASPRGVEPLSPG